MNEGGAAIAGAGEPEPIQGVLFAWSETGTEGVVWSVQDERHMRARPDGSPEWDYEGLNPLRDGDRLAVLRPDGSVEWEGIVALEYGRRRRPYPLNPADGQQEVHGFWVNGLQRDLAPETWAAWFFEGRPARLVPACPPLRR